MSREQTDGFPPAAGNRSTTAAEVARMVGKGELEKNAAAGNLKRISSLLSV
jgi:hypothetical protein